MPLLNKTGLSLAEMTDDERAYFGVEEEPDPEFVAYVEGPDGLVAVPVPNPWMERAKPEREPITHNNLEVEYFTPVHEATLLNQVYLCPKCRAYDITALNGKVCRDCGSAKARRQRTNGAFGGSNGND